MSNSFYENILKERETRLLNLSIPQIKEIIDFFKKLDEEYKLYAENTSSILANNFLMFSPKFIKNKNWRGFWYRATGRDTDLYIHWLISGLDKDTYNSLIESYKEAHPREKYIPYSIIKANNTLLQIKKGTTI